MLVTIVVFFTIAYIEIKKIEYHHYLQRTGFFESHPAQPGDIVFLGDSLTAGCNWDEIFPDLNIKNRGINTDTTSGVLQRLDAITQGQPTAVFILIGTNDLTWYEFRKDEMILGTYQKIIEKIHHDSPSTIIFVESLLPRAHFQAKRIKEFNPKLKKLAERIGAEYIDLYSFFTDSTGNLRSELNNDHLHLLAKGYEVWTKALNPYLKVFRKEENFITRK
jgi:lysophospholipase L1-like esterase